MDTSTDTAGLAQHMGRELITGHAYSSRRAIRVDYGFPGYREFVRPARGSVADNVRDAIRDAIRADRETGRARERRDAGYFTSGPSRAHIGDAYGLGSWADRDVIIAVTPDYGRGRGNWTWTAYEDLRPQVSHELEIGPECAYLATYGEFNDGTDWADRAHAAALAFWGDALGRLIVGDEVGGYAPIYTCGYCREEHEGEQYSAVILDR